MVPALVVAEGDVVAGYQTVITALSNVLSESELATVLAYGAGVAVGLCLLWFSVRKVSSMLMRAFKRGKLRL